MITGMLSVIGICLGVLVVVGLAGVGFACGIMHGLRWLADKIKWILRIDPKN